MTRLATRDCACTLHVALGQKRPATCKCGNPYLTEAQLNPKPRKARRRSQPRRIWDAARAKVDSEGRCRVCGSTSHVEAAHVMGRSHDEPIHPGSRTLYVDPDRIVPLCGPFPDGCHGAFDKHQIDLLKYLRPEEQARAVADAGGIEEARRKLVPSEYREVAA